MFGRTLSLYFARHFARMVLSIFMLAFLLITVVTYVEFFNRAFRGDFIGGFTLALVALFRVPSVTEDTLPFAVLYGSIAAFVVANRRLEVVVARAAGVSAMQFLVPACVVGLIIGIVGTTLYNPFAASLLGWSNTLTMQVLPEGRRPTVSSGTGPVWVRQATGNIESVVGAPQSYDDGLGLIGVTAYVFDRGGKFRERIDADRAHYLPGLWRLEKATVTAPNTVPRKVANYDLPTNLSVDDVKRTFLQVDSVSFWALPGLAASAQRAGVSGNRFLLQYNVLLSRPILLLAMVLIAANVSLRFSRSRDVGWMIIAGVGVGFMLYVLMKIAWDLGSGGIVPPPLAAWLPACVATLFGVTVLLHLEDG
jgi:lipopolysaccharide export system permease protein